MDMTLCSKLPHPIMDSPSQNQARGDRLSWGNCQFPVDIVCLNVVIGLPLPSWLVCRCTCLCFCEESPHILIIVLINGDGNEHDSPTCPEMKPGSDLYHLSLNWNDLLGCRSIELLGWHLILTACFLWDVSCYQSIAFFFSGKFCELLPTILQTPVLFAF